MTTDGTTSENSFIYKGPLAARMACHIGNFTPVAICNILGDQPLFYIDYVDQEEADFIDASALDNAGIPAEYFADNLDDLRRRMARLESASHHIDGYIREHTEGAFDKSVAALTQDSTLLTEAEVTAIITQSRMLGSFYADASARGLTVKMDAQVDAAVYDRDAKTIRVNPRLSAGLVTISLARALRQAWLHFSGAAIHPLHFAPEEAVLLNRIQEADLAVSTIRAAWEANLAGNKDSWSRIITISGYDLAVGFAREAIADFRALNNGNAGHAAFERWFFSGRCKDVDRKLIQQMLADNHGLIFENPQVSKMVTGDIIAKTGEMPVGRNYLSSLIEVILSDPLFTEVRDRSNANFLWFIKFERSFRATETDMEHSLQGVIPSVSTADVSETPNATPAPVIAFTKPNKRVEKRNASKKGEQDMATVYYIDHFLSFSNR